MSCGSLIELLNRAHEGPGTNSACAYDRAERTPKQSQCAAEQLRRLCLEATLFERKRQVTRREQRIMVLCTEQASLLYEDLALDLHGLGVLALL